MFWTKKMFSSAGDVVVDVRDVVAAQRRYSEKLGLSYSSGRAHQEFTTSIGSGYRVLAVYLVLAFSR